MNILRNYDNVVLNLWFYRKVKQLKLAIKYKTTVKYAVNKILLKIVINEITRIAVEWLSKANCRRISLYWTSIPLSWNDFDSVQSRKICVIYMKVPNETKAIADFLVLYQYWRMWWGNICPDRSNQTNLNI